MPNIIELTEPHCDNSGVCSPVENLGTQSTCQYCGKELHLVDNEWKTWDFDIVCPT